MQVVHYKVGKVNFEIGTKTGAVTKYKADHSFGIKNVLDSEIVWKDLKKGDRASGQDLMTAFKTDDVWKVAETIIDKGELQLTESERKEILSKRRNEIVNYIHKYYADPKTKLPHPVIRVDAALNELKVKIDPDIATEKQVLEIMKTLPTILPCKKIEIQGTIIVPQNHLKNAVTVIKKFAKMSGEKKVETGTSYNISCVPGDVNSLISELNAATKGECDIQFESDTTFTTTTTTDETATTAKGRTQKSQRGGKK